MHVAVRPDLAAPDLGGGPGVTVAVGVAVLGGGHEQVSRLVDGALGWVVVDPGDPVLPARCVVADAAGVAAGLVPPGVPLVLLVGEADDPVAVARAARGALEVLPLPPDAGALRAAVEGVGPPGPLGRGPWCTVAAAAGGVGATTVATALAGLRAWRHGRTLLATSGAVHADGAPQVAVSDLASPAVWAAASPAVGVSDLRVVVLAGPTLTALPALDLPLVLDVGVALAHETVPDLLVLRPDRAGVEALAASPTALAVVVGPGPMGGADVRAAASGREIIEVPWSARVARACAVGRMPTDAPGAWLRPLAPLVDRFSSLDVTAAPGGGA